MKQRKRISVNNRKTRVIFFRFAAIEIFILLAAMIILSLYSISMYKTSVYNSFARNTNIIVTALSSHCKGNESRQALTDEEARIIFNGVDNFENPVIYLFDESGTCIITSDSVKTPVENISISSEIISELKDKGFYTLNNYSELNIDINAPVICQGTAFSITEPDESITQYFLFVRFQSRVIDLFIRNIWICSLLLFIMLLSIALIITYFLVLKQMRTVQEIADVSKEYVKGNFSKMLSPDNFSDTGYEEIICNLNDLAYAVKNSDTQRTEFISNVSHELRTPMTIISGYVDAILDGTIQKGKRTQYLSIVSAEMQRLKILISSMLNLTKFDNGTLQINLQDFVINDIVFRTILMFESRLEKKNISVEGLDTDSLHVWGDPDLLGQVIYNLIENAVKFVNINGTISFRFEQHENGTEFAVRNTGAGIPADELPKIFERFYKVDSSRSQDKTGLGLGLNITRRIINLHKGQIKVESEEHKYTEFIICLSNKQKSD